MKSHWHSVGSHRLHVREDGLDGNDVVVLVHGLIMSSRYMVPLARALAPRFRVYVPDLPGFGRSTSDEILDTCQLGTVLAQWLQVADLRNVILVGNSYGCQIAAEALTVDASRVDRLMFIGPSVDPAARSRLRQVWRMAREWWREPLWFWFTGLHDLVDCGVPRAWKTFEHLIAHDMLVVTEWVDRPVLIVRGQHDRVCPMEWAETLAKVGGTDDVSVIAGVAHTAQTRRPAEIAELLTRA